MGSRGRPGPISDAERRARQRRVATLSRQLSFTGSHEYRHVYSQTGGAQYCIGSDEVRDLLIVFAEAFDRDADPEDFSLTAIIAHERGHQLLIRHPQIARLVTGRMTGESEEILASLLGAIISPNLQDRDALVAKAVVELIEYGVAPELAVTRLQELWTLLESLL